MGEYVIVAEKMKENDLNVILIILIFAINN